MSLCPLFKDLADNQTKYTLELIDQEEYCHSWMDSIEARLFYLAESVMNAALLPFSSLKALLGFGAYFFTWGRQSDLFWSGMEEIKNGINRIVIGAIGAMVSTAAAYELRETNIFSSALNLIYLIAPTMVKYRAAGGSFSALWNIRKEIPKELLTTQT